MFKSILFFMIIFFTFFYLCPMLKKISGNFYTVLIARMAILVLIYSISRILFYFFNQDFFQELSNIQLLKILIAGIRFDLSVIFLLNTPLIFLSSVPLRIRYHKLYQKICTYLYVIPNSIFFLFNCIDLVYFRFTLKRTTSGVFAMFGKGNDLLNLLPQFLLDFWYVLLIWIILIAILIYLQNRFILNKEKKIFYARKDIFKYYFIQFIWFVLTCGTTVIGVRGGLQLIPISIISAGQYASSQNIPLVLNTPFAITATFNNNEITDVKYYGDKTVSTIYNPCHSGKTNDSFKKMNIVIIILESFSKEFSGYLNQNLCQGTYKGYTPFLDSLMREGLVFDHAFANGQCSMEAMPSVIASIPALMNNPYIVSNFSGNKICSIAYLLKSKGYTSSFFHGGTNGTMGFDNFITMSGFDNYFGRTEYNNEKDYDGNWGIFDEEFLQFTANKINQIQSPSLSVIFTLSSHHPFKIPEKYINKFPEEKLPITASIRYADYSLRRFFETASKMPWFNNTLFVLTADHTFSASHPLYQTRVGRFAIPIIFYKPNSDLKGVNSNIIQQIDIMPSILYYLKYPEPYFAFGNSVFDSTAHRYSITFSSSIYQLIQDNYVLQFDGEKVKAFYDYKNDKLLRKNIVSKDNKIRTEMEVFIKAFIQTFNNRMLSNRLYLK